MCGLCSLKRANNNSQNPGNEVMMMLVTQYLSFRAKLRVWAPSCCCSHIQVISNYVSLCSGARNSLTICTSPENLLKCQEIRAFKGMVRFIFHHAASRKTKITILRIIFQKHSKLQPWGAQGKGTLPHVRNMHPLQCRPWTGTYSPLGYHRTLVRFNLRRSSYVHIHMVDTHILYIHTYIHIYIYTYIYIYIYSYVFTCRTRYMLCMSMLPLLP